MSQQLCFVCRNIPEDFWSRAYDLFESRRGAKAKLQSYNGMQKQGKQGCQLCTIFVASIWLKKLEDHNECLHLRRDYGDPHRAFCLATEKFPTSLGTLYFFRVPDIWCESAIARFNDETDNVRLMRTWVRNRILPSEAASSMARRFLPTRLLDVEAFTESDDVRLVVSQDIRAASTPSYLALSHCWGGIVPIRLEMNSVKSWIKRGVAFGALPKTFRDAIQITRQLGIRYLWIDSMCIIQDCMEDWKQEASFMAEVYSNAVCTLAALSSKDSSEGCKVISNIQASLKSPYVELKAELHRSSRIRIFQKMPRSWVEEFNGQSLQAGVETDSPLRTRAWVLQEKELSNCTIYFAKNQLLWENKEHKATAQLPWEETTLGARSGTPRMMRENLSHQIIGAPQYPWYELVEDYASRSLTFPTDKLIAFSGLAKDFGCGRKQYLAGIWSTDLPAALLWRVNDYAATRPAYLAPSWSWASLMGSVTYESLRLEPGHDSAQYEHPEDIYPGLKTLKVRSVQMTLEDKDKEYANVREGRIILSGTRCIRVQCGPGVVRFSDGGQPLTQNKAPIGVFYPDIAGETALLKDTYCVALQSESMRSFRRHQLRLKQDGAMRSMVMGIVVTSLPKRQEYRRVGLARWMDESLFDAVPTTTVELI
ncbi:HET-domain-containing protein [Macroventuria anomochaeta]|uniref:HET-domain-containing protein n=1 Tax=Macroventuria anomochaeta TaxID=301207 RepID=A0ACB6S586_9PLEO|nr:HET-domain-containing protein [Macroventuria anomochaeta]KAF2629341.1 HET-domain-containing protein [Macroventuria anomochaeta]